MRRNWKRILSLLLTVAMVFTMNTSVFAGVSTVSTTVTRNDDNKTYTRTVKVSADGEGGTYTVGEETRELEPNATAEYVESSTLAYTDLTDEEKGTVEEPEADPVVLTPLYKYNDKYYDADGVETTFVAGTHEEKAVADIPAEKKPRNLFVLGEKYYTSEDDAKNDQNAVDNATALEKAMATEVTIESSPAPNDDENGDPANGANAEPPAEIGWKLVSDLEGKSEITKTVDDGNTFYYEETANADGTYNLRISSNYIMQGYYLQAVEVNGKAPSPVKIRVMDIDGDTGYTVSVSAVKESGVAARVAVEGGTKISLSDNNTRAFSYTQSSGLYAEIDSHDKKSGGGKGAVHNITLVGNETYIAIPADGSKAGTVSTPDAKTGVVTATNTVIYPDADQVVAGLAADGNPDGKISLTVEKKDKTNVPRVTVATDAGAKPGTHQIFAVTEGTDRSKITIKGQTVVALSGNGVTGAQTKGTGSAYDSFFQAKLKTATDNSKVTASINATTPFRKTADGQYGENQILWESMQISLVSGNTPFVLQTPRAVKTDSATEEEYENLEGNTVYSAVVRSVSSADTGFVNETEKVLYIPSAWVEADTTAKTRPSAGSIKFSKVTVENIGTTTASVNIIIDKTKDTFVPAGIYVVDSKSPATNSDNAVKPDSKWYLSDNRLNAKGRITYVDQTTKRIAEGDIDLTDNYTLQFSLSSDVLQPGKLYYVYAMGYLKADNRVDMPAENMVFGNEPIAVFSTVGSYTLGLKQNINYEGENFKYDGSTMTIGAAYKGYGTSPGTAPLTTKGATLNAFYNADISSFTMTLLSSNGSTITLDKAALEKIETGEAYQGVNTAMLEKYALFAGLETTAYSGILNKLGASNSKFVTRTLVRNDGIKTLANTAESQKESIKLSDADKSFTYKISVNDIIDKDGKDLAPTEKTEKKSVESAAIPVSVVKTNLYAYPAFNYDKYSDHTISSGSISAGDIKFSIGWSDDTQIPAEGFNYEKLKVETDAYTMFKLADANGKDLFTFNDKIFPKKVVPGEYRLTLTGVSKLKTSSTIDGFNFTLATAGDYTYATVATDYDNIATFKKDTKGGQYPYTTVIADVTEGGDVVFTLTRNKNVPIAYGTMSANDGKEAYLLSAFDTTVNIKGNTTDNYKKFKNVKIKFTTDKAAAEKVTKNTVSQETASLFAGLGKAVNLEDVDAGTTVYAVVLLDVDSLTGSGSRTLTDVYGPQAAMAPVTVEKRKVTISWNAGQPTWKTTTPGDPIIAKIARGDKVTLDKDIVISSNQLNFFTIYANDASGNAITKFMVDNKSETKNGGKVLKTTSENISPKIFYPYNSKTETWELAGNKGMDPNSKANDNMQLDKSNVDVTLSGEYKTTLGKLPVLSSNTIKIDEKTYKAFKDNFEITAQNIKVEVTKRTTVTFKAAYGTSTPENETFDINDSAALTTLDAITFVDSDVAKTKAARGSSIKGMFVKTTGSANVIPAANMNKKIGDGEIVGFYIDGDATINGLRKQYQGELVDSLADVSIYPDKDYVVTAKIKIYVTDQSVTTYQNGEQKINISTIQPVVYDGRAHVITSEVLKYNLTSKVNDVDLQLTCDTTNDGLDNPTTLIVGKHYKVSYKNNTNANVYYDETGKLQSVTGAKQPQIIVTGMGDYKGLKLSINFNIVANDLKTDDIKPGQINLAWDQQNAGVFVATSVETADTPIIVIDTLLRSTNDSKGMILKPKFVIERTFTSGKNSDNTEKKTTKKVNLGKKDYTARVLDAERKDIGELGKAYVKPSSTKTIAHYIIKVTGQGNYQGTIEKDVYVFSKNDPRLLDNATVNWDKQLGKITYSKETKIDDIVDSVKTKDKTIWSVAAGAADPAYALSIEYKAPGANSFMTVADMVALPVATKVAGGNFTTANYSDYDAGAGKAGAHLMPGTYRVKLIGKGLAGAAYDETKLYGVSKTKQFTVKGENLPAITFTGIVADANVGTANEKAQIGSNGKAFTEKNLTLDYTGYETNIKESFNSGKGIRGTDYRMSFTTVDRIPGTYKLKVEGLKQYYGKSKTFTIKRKAANMGKFVKENDFTINVVTKPYQNVNGAYPAGREEIYLTLFGEKVGYDMGLDGADNAVDQTGGPVKGTTYWSYNPKDDGLNTGHIHFIHTISGNKDPKAAHYGEVYEGYLTVKFSNNTKVGDKTAKLTATGVNKYKGADKDSFVTGSGLNTTYSIQAMVIDPTAGANLNINRYSALDHATNNNYIEAGELYYTVEDVQIKNDKWSKPKFTLKQATLDGKLGKVVPTADYDIAFESLSTNNPKNIRGLDGKLTANKAKGNNPANYKTKNNKVIDITGVYVYDEKASLNKKDITVKDKSKATSAEQKNSAMRWLDQDSKNSNLTYTYNGLYVDIPGSLDQINLKAGKNEVLVGDVTNAKVKTAVSNAVEIIELKPNTLAQKEGSYTATLRIRPDVVKVGATADKAGTQYGGTIKVQFKINAMDKDKIKL